MKRLGAAQQVDQFRIVRKLGQGGMSEVYLARDTTLGRKVALKFIRAEFADSPRRLQLFLQEAQLTAKFSHPHIISIHFVGQFEGHPYLALEYLEGQTLTKRIREGPMSARETIRIGLAIAEALAEAHSHGVLHRDLKPANVMIPQDGRLRVLDFGISKIIEDSIHPQVPAKAHTNETRPEETALGVIKGTPSYMAPERWLGEKVTGGSDVWALGVILFRALTQTHPFPGKDQSVEAISRRIVLAQHPPPLPQDLNVPSELSELIISMLDTETSLRPTAKKVVEVFQGLLRRNRGFSFEKGSPFRGLLPFSERHADLFFGRSTEIEMAVERLRNEPILPVVGPSGAGKSSFVAAGIVPRLRELTRWIVLTVRPGTDPFGALSSSIQAGWQGDRGNTISPSGCTASDVLEKYSNLRNRVGTLDSESDQKGKDQPKETLTELTAMATDAILPKKEKELLNGARLEVNEAATASILPKESKNTQKDQSIYNFSERYPSSVKFSQTLRENPATLLLELQALADKTQGKVLLFVDQLEELYTQNHALELCRAYMNAISRAADDPKGPIRVVFTLRDDFLGHVADTSSAREVLSRITVLRAPEEEALFEVVTKPVEIAGYSYEDQGLPEEMLDAVRGAPASLPILQFACSQLWNRRDLEKRMLTRSAYESMGGVEGALASEADELLAGLSKAQQQVVKQLMLRLVTPEGTRRVMVAQELLDGLDPSAQLVLDRLTAARMVVSRRATNREDAEAELELVHDSLIRSWNPLVRWLEQNREEVVFLDEVSRAATLWESRGCLGEEVWSGDALDVARAKLKSCEAVPNKVKKFLEAGELQRRARAQGRRKIVLAIISVLIAIITVLVFVIREVNIQREISDHQREIAETERERQQQAHASALREGARAAYIKGDFLEARSKLRGSLEVRDSTPARALWWLLENEPLIWSGTLGSAATSVSVSPDARLIAVSGMSINIFDTKTLEQRILSGHKGEVMTLDFAPNGHWLSSGALDRDIRLWNLREGTSKVLKGHTSIVWAVVFSPDGKRLASGSYDKTIRIWDIESGALIRTLENNSKVWQVLFSPDGRFIISLHPGDDKVHLWNAQNYKLEQSIEEPGIQIYNAAISADGKLLAYIGSDGVLVVRNFETLQEHKRIFGVTRLLDSLSFSSSGEFLAASADDGRVLVWDTKTWSLFRQFRHSKVPINSLVFIPDNEQLVSAGSDGTLKVWKMESSTFQKESTAHRFPIFSLAFTPDGKTIATGSSVDGELRFWDATSGQSLQRIHGHDADISDIAFSHNGKLLALGADDGSIRLYTFPEGQLLKTLYGHKSNVGSVIFSSDGKQLMSSSFDHTIAFWDLESLTLKKSINTSRSVRSIDIAPNAPLFASANPNDVQIRDIKTGRVRTIFSGHTDLVYSVAFSPDGKSLYSSSWDHTVRQYALGSASTVGKVVARHQGVIHSIDVTHFTEDILGTPSEDKLAKLWKIDSHEVITLKGHRGEINVLRFSPDGTQVATVSTDCTLRLWDTKTGRPLWRAPLLLEEPPLLVTEQGWIGFEDTRGPSPSNKQWQKAVEAQGKLASATADRETLCLATFADELEIWDRLTDQVTFKMKQPGIQQVLSIHQGCLTRSDETLTLTRATGKTVTLGTQVEAMSRYEDSVFVLQGDMISIRDLEGNQQDEFRATSGATALTVVGTTLVLGFPDGRLEIWSRDGSSSKRDFICREAEGNPAITIIPGPPGTIIAGFEHGMVGIWSIDTGERLFSHRIHGPVTYLLLQDHTLYAATELGSRVQFDLSTFYIEYCELMKRVWSDVFWIWEEGRARYRDIPSEHECSPRR